MATVRQLATIILFTLLILILLLTGRSLDDRPHFPLSTKQKVCVAIAVKSSASSLLANTPIRLLTFLGGQDVIIVSDNFNNTHRIGNVDIVDVTTPAFQDTTTDLIRAQELLDEERLELDRRSNPIPKPVIRKGPVNIKPAKKQQKASSSVNADRLKHLPAFKLLGTRFPQADWFMLINDDAFLFKHNLVQFLSAFDPSKPWFFGQGMLWSGCAGYKKMGDGPAMASSGGGILMSRGAMGLFLNVVDECTREYAGCWAGEIRLALCLQKRNITLFNGNMQGHSFHSTSPANVKEFEFPRNPCARPLTFAKLSGPHEVQALHELSSPFGDNDSGGIVTMADIHDAFHGDSIGVVLKNFDRPGSDLRDLPAANAAECQKLCESEVKCVSWVLTAGKKCLLKNGVQKLVEQKGSVSGVVAGRYQCK